jgi:hypothetical protein
MEWLRLVAEDEAVAFNLAIAMRSPGGCRSRGRRGPVHERARREVPWCGPLDHDPANVMRGADGRLVVADLFYADGPTATVPSVPANRSSHGP